MVVRKTQFSPSLKHLKPGFFLLAAQFSLFFKSCPSFYAQLVISLLKKTSDEEASFTSGIPVTIFRRNWTRDISFFFLSSPDMIAFNKRMDTLESKLMYDSEKLHLKLNYSLLPNMIWNANTRWQGSKLNCLNPLTDQPLELCSLTLSWDGKVFNNPAIQ